jgi:CubicO group peptidase (beta-lactamase class C family)
MTETSADQRLPKALAAIRRGPRRRTPRRRTALRLARNETIADLALGVARENVPMRTDTLMLWLSAGKPVAAVAIAQLWERGLLDLDDPVAKHIPEFAANGKDVVTIRHILTHTGGFRALLGHWENKPWDEVIAALAASRLEPRWVPGHTAGYHPITSWYLLGELVRRLDGRPFDQYVREAIFLPCAMRDTWIGMPAEQYRAYSDRIGLMHEIKPGQPPTANYSLDSEELAAQTRPPTNARGPIRELGLFYETLRDRGREVLRPQTVEAITARHRVGVYDKTFKHVIDWGLGFVMQSNQYGVDTVPYGYGPHASPRTFGHSGSRSSIGYCDPEHGLVVACLFNGAPDEPTHDKRMREVNAAIYEDLGLAPTTAAPETMSS